MSIVSSVIADDSAQSDGRRHIREEHTDHLGAIHRIFWMATAGQDVSVRMAARVPEIEATLQDREMVQNVGYIMAGPDFYGLVSAQHQTLADVRAALRALYQTESGEIIGRLSRYLLTLSDAQLQAIFAISAGEVPALRSRLTTRAQVVIDLDALAGE